MPNSSNEMHIFTRVVERGSFAAAADDLGLSPSAVSKLVTRLESRLGVRLFNRTTRRLALTAEGDVFLDRSRKILDAIEAAESEVTLDVGHRRDTCGSMPFPRSRLIIFPSH